MSVKNLLLIGMLASLISSSAFAALIVHIDVTNEKYWLTGSATGEFGSYLGGNATWVISSNSSSTDVGLVGDLTQIASTTNGVSIIGGGIGATDSNFTFNIRSNSTATTTITGAGESFAIDYSGADPTVKSNFESGIGQTTSSETEGSTFGTLTIVPEPANYTLIFGALTLAGMMVFRRK